MLQKILNCFVLRVLRNCHEVKPWRVFIVEFFIRNSSMLPRDHLLKYKIIRTRLFLQLCLDLQASFNVFRGLILRLEWDLGHSAKGYAQYGNLVMMCGIWLFENSFNMGNWDWNAWLSLPWVQLIEFSIYYNQQKWITLSFSTSGI